MTASDGISTPHPRRFSGRFLLNAKYPVIPAPQPTFPPSFPHHPHRFKPARKLFRVIPTKVGIQNVKSKETVLSNKFPHRQLWIPACAGMTNP
ncbi:TPA: hypothetical protein ACJCQW_002122, partial [Neisseria meningitidis]